MENLNDKCCFDGTTTHEDPPPPDDVNENNDDLNSDILLYPNPSFNQLNVFTSEMYGNNKISIIIKDIY